MNDNINMDRTIVGSMNDNINMDRTIGTSYCTVHIYIVVH
jgi:hypothetical protein